MRLKDYSFHFKHKSVDFEGKNLVETMKISILLVFCFIDPFCYKIRSWPPSEWNEERKRDVTKYCV